MTINSYLKQRLQNTIKKLDDLFISQYLVSSPANIKYLTGISSVSSYHRELFILLSNEKPLLIHSPLIQIGANTQRLYKTIQLGSNNTLSSILTKYTQRKELYADYKDLRAMELINLKKKTKLTLKPIPDIIEEQRIIKDEFELRLISKSCQITHQVWQKILPKIKPGISEKVLQSQIISLLIKAGSDFPSQEFTPIVASGPNSAIPHHATSSRIIKKGDVVLVDFGCSYSGYWSDMTRTIQLGHQTSKFRKVKEIVNKAYEYGVETIQLNPTNAAPDQQIFEFLKQKGYQNSMPHTTGHGIGLNVHELPSLSRFSPIETIKNNTTFTIEPGIYIPGEFGIRFENTLVLKNNKVQVLTI